MKLILPYMVVIMAYFVYSWPKTHIDKPLFGKKPGEWTLPGHNYIGPGNPVSNSFPVDKDDLIALRHDQDYHNARTEEEVRSADREVISEFWKDTKENYNIHSLIGTVGLGIKYGVESATVVLYPCMETPPATPAKRTHPVDTQEPGPSSKVQVMDTDPQVAASMQKTSGDNKMMGTSGSAVMNPMVDRALSNANKGTYIFKHK